MASSAQAGLKEDDTDLEAKVTSVEEIVVSINDKNKTRTYPARETVIPLSRVPFLSGELRFNPFTSIFGIVFLWGLSAYCMSKPEDALATLSLWLINVQEYFTWFFIVANPICAFFVVWLAFRYGHIKLGDKDAEPEFSDISYFCMIFSAGVGIGLFFFGVAEPLMHRNYNFISNAGYHSQDEIDQWSLLLTLNHWGFPLCWSKYLIMAIASSLCAYKFGLPMTVRSTVYPILGDYCWGWMGDIIDGFSIVMTVAGICTSLGLGAIQMTVGLQRLGWVSPVTESDYISVQVIIIWAVTLVATVSVISGVAVGIKTLAILAFGVGTLILFLCFIMEKTFFLLNLLVQTTGLHLQWNIFQLSFWTDAFGSLGPGEGRAVDGNAAASWWIGSWTTFYSAWWVSWVVFVGLFVARISKNRTIRNVILSVGLAAVSYSILWFSVMGGIGLRQQRQALELMSIGEISFGDASYYRVDGSDYCYNVPQSDVVVDNIVVFTNNLLGITPVCELDTSDSSNAWFNVMYSFSYPDASTNFAGFGPFLTAFSVFALGIYFITSSDSGSLVVDILASTGGIEHHWLQRIFWAFTEGALATALLIAGGSDALTALQSASIVFSLPFNGFLFLICISIVRMCHVIEKEQLESGMGDPNHLLPAKTWSMPIFGGILNIFEFIISLGYIDDRRKIMGMDLPTKYQTMQFFISLFFPFVTLYRLYSITDDKNTHILTNILTTTTYAILFIATIAFFICSTINHGFVAFGWTAFFVNASILTSLRLHVRGRLAIHGNVIGDFFACSFLYPQALAQMMHQFKEEGTADVHYD